MMEKVRLSVEAHPWPQPPPPQLRRGTGSNFHPTAHCRPSPTDPALMSTSPPLGRLSPSLNPKDLKVPDAGEDTMQDMRTERKYRGEGVGVRFWGLREAPLAQGRLSFPLETLEKAEFFPVPALPSLDGPGSDRAPAAHPARPSGSPISTIGSLPSWPRSWSSDLGAVWVGRQFGGKRSSSGNLCSVLVTPPGGPGMSSGLLLQQEGRTFWLCIAVGPNVGRKESGMSQEGFLHLRSVCPGSGSTSLSQGRDFMA